LRFPILGFVRENQVQLWDLETGTVLQRLVTGSLLGQLTTNREVQLSPDGRRIATVSLDHQVMLWDLFTLKPLFPKPLAHRGTVSFRFSRDGGKLVTVDAERHLVQVWDSRSGRRLLSEEIPLVQLGKVFFTRQGDRLVLREYLTTSSGTGTSKQTVGD